MAVSDDGVTLNGCGQVGSVNTFSARDGARECFVLSVADRMTLAGNTHYLKRNFFQRLRFQSSCVASLL